MRCTVVGAGVIGLSCAVRLQTAGHDVTVVSDLAPADTTSAVAAAIWYPYLAAPRDRVGVWGAQTYAELCRLAEASPESGVRVRRGYEVFRAGQPDPWWAAAVPDLRRMTSSELQPPYRDGWTFHAPVVDMSVYLQWLVGLLAALRVKIIRRHVQHLEDELADAEVVINCGGLAGGRLVGDSSVRPVRGQIVVLTNPGLEEWWLDDENDAELTYVIPRLETVVIGGTAQVGADDLHPDDTTAGAVLRRGRALVPLMAHATVLAHRVGLRPARPEVRLEREDSSDGSIVHCYGHGGAGVTLSWGCADEVARLVGS